MILSFFSHPIFLQNIFQFEVLTTSSLAICIPAPAIVVPTFFFPLAFAGPKDWGVHNKDPLKPSMKITRNVKMILYEFFYTSHQKCVSKQSNLNFLQSLISFRQTAFGSAFVGESNCLNT
jgi:hypothetical protein